MAEVYQRLAAHLGKLGMGYPQTPELLDLLEKLFSPSEAEVALALPWALAPLEAEDCETVCSRSDLPEAEVAAALEAMAQRRVIYSTLLEEGRRGYALLQVGYGMPQTFFWGGPEDPRARAMAGSILSYFSVPTTGLVYGDTPTKAFKYAPAELAVKVPLQGVLPTEQMAPIVQGAQKIALAHCPCRTAARVLGRRDCQHSLEVCFKYDEMAEFVLDKGLARPVSVDEALAILSDCEAEGLVHMVDNAQGGVKHTCNCCGHYCWNVGIIARRKIPRDRLMAVYFLRDSQPEECLGCGACADICPVGAVSMATGIAQVDTDWCIGCGVCAVACPAGAIGIGRRLEQPAPASFADLHRQIQSERKQGPGGTP